MKKRFKLAGSLIALLAAQTTFAAATSISNFPLAGLTTLEPNLIFILDDSDSIDGELLFNTYAGALWWNGTTKSFTDGSGNPLTPANFIPGNSSGTPWFEYIYLFPNGNGNPSPVIPTTTTRGARRTPDDFYWYYGYYAVPPIPAFAWTRDYEYNPLYYNPFVTYGPWPNAYINNGVSGYSQGNVSFSQANPTAALGDPSIPGSPTMNLTSTLTTTASNYTFRMVQGMTIPGASISGIQARQLTTAFNSYGAWAPVTTNLLIPNGKAYDVAIPYYPATYYVRDATCTSGPTCAVGPDGLALRQYQITSSNNTYPSGRTYAAEIQNFANWYQYYRKRKFMVASAMGNVLAQTYDLRAAIVTENNVQNNVTNAINMVDFNSTNPATNAQAILGVVDTNQSAIVSQQTAPAAAHYTLNFVGKQYMNNSSIIQAGCQVNASMFVTDGYPDVAPYVPMPVLPAYNRTTWGGTTPYTTTYANTIADIALYFYTTNLRPSFPTGLVPTNSANVTVNPDLNTNLHMSTYAFSLTSKGTIYGTGTPQATDPFANPPTWPGLAAYTDGAPALEDDMWHAALNSRAQMFNAQTFVATAGNFQSIIASIFSQASSGSSIGVSSPNITSSNNVAYVASYQSNSGDLAAYSIDINTGIISTTKQWDAASLLDAKNFNTRYIATFNGTNGIPFQWGSLSTTMQNSLNSPSTPPGPSDGQNILNYIRGDRSLETAVYRPRFHVLGDIVDANPAIVTGAVANYTDAGYTTFSNSVSSRTPMIYQGANDGMLHAFNLSTGQEAWAYIPGVVVSNLNALAGRTYSHRFYVDGTPTVGDVTDSSNNWHTILVGGLRAGGSGFYALDITDPSAASDSSVASKVLWEFPNNSTPTNVKNNIGLSFGQPVIVKTAAAGWVVLLTSGYNNINGDGKGHLFVLNAMTGSLIADILTTSGSSSSPSGLAQISAFAKNPSTNALIDYAYGGDLNGNVWRFDLSGTNTSSWNVKLLATLVDGSGTAQPITTAPELWQNGAYRMVYVGTGQLLGSSDLTSNATQTMYGLVDNMTNAPTISPLRSNLVQRTISGNTISNTPPVNYATNRGWYFDLKQAGERVTVDPIFALGTLVFNTNYPDADSCSAQGYEYVVDPNSGGGVAGGLFNGTSASIIALSTGLASKPTIIALPNGKVIAITHNSDNTITTLSIPTSSGIATTRSTAWKEVIAQ